MQTIHQCMLCGGKINAFKVDDKDAAEIAQGCVVFNQESFVTQIIFGEDGTKGKIVYTHVSHQCPDGKIGIAKLVGFQKDPATHRAGCGLN